MPAHTQIYKLMYSILVVFCPCCCPYRDRYAMGGCVWLRLSFFD